MKQTTSLCYTLNGITLTHTYDPMRAPPSPTTRRDRFSINGLNPANLSLQDVAALAELFKVVEVSVSSKVWGKAKEDVKND